MNFSAARIWLSAQAAAGRLDPAHFNDARRALRLVPSSQGWARIVWSTLGAAGLGFLAAALMFAVAFNWDALGHFSRFALVQACLALFVVLAWWRGTDTPAGEAALFGACLATGALLALFGQTYQTGADPWSLFLVWAILILPWLVHARRASPWLLWLLITNTALTLYCVQVLGQSRWLGVFGLFEGSALLTLVVNGALLVVFERLQWLGAAGLAHALPRVLAAIVLGAVAAILIPMIGWHGGGNATWSGALTALLALCAFACVWWHAFKVRRDIVILSAGTLCAVGVGYAMLMRLVMHGDPFGFFLFSAMYWIAAIAAAVLWLRDLHAGRPTKEQA